MLHKNEIKLQLKFEQPFFSNFYSFLPKINEQIKLSTKTLDIS